MLCCPPDLSWLLYWQPWIIELLSSHAQQSSECELFSLNFLLVGKRTFTYADPDNSLGLPHADRVILHQNVSRFVAYLDPVHKLFSKEEEFFLTLHLLRASSSRTFGTWLVNGANTFNLHDTLKYWLTKSVSRRFSSSGASNSTLFVCLLDFRIPQRYVARVQNSRGQF